MAVSGHLDHEPSQFGSRRQLRRRLSLETLGELASGEVANVIVHNASTGGLLLQSSVDLEIGDRIELDLPHAGPTSAKVIWRSGDLSGCRFTHPISQAALSAAQLRSSAGEPIGFASGSPRPPASLGSRLRRLRTERNLTLDQVATALGVSKPTVWAWEQGKAKPQDKRLGAIASVLNVSQRDLLAESEDGERQEMLDEARDRIARAFGTSPHRIRIMIDL